MIEDERKMNLVFFNKSVLQSFFEDQEGNNSFVISHFEEIFSDELIIEDERKMDLVF